MKQIKSLFTRIAIKDHICNGCNGIITKKSMYFCVVCCSSKKEEKTYSSVKLHSYGDCVNTFLKENEVVIKDETSIDGLESRAFYRLLTAMRAFRNKWKNVNLFTSEDKADIVNNVNVASLFGLHFRGEYIGKYFLMALFEALDFEKDKIPLYIQLEDLADDVERRTKFSYSLKHNNIYPPVIKEVADAIELLKNERDKWTVIDGPKYPHPEIAEYLTDSEIKMLQSKEKGGA